MAERGRPKGIPKTGGKTKGTPNKKTRLLAEQAAAEGISMAQIMARSARALWHACLADDGTVRDLDMAERAGELAIKAAPYFHPKLNSVELTGGLTVSHEQALEALR